MPVPGFPAADYLGPNDDGTHSFSVAGGPPIAVAPAGMPPELADYVANQTPAVHPNMSPAPAPAPVEDRPFPGLLSGGGDYSGATVQTASGAKPSFLATPEEIAADKSARATAQAAATAVDDKAEDATLAELHKKQAINNAIGSMRPAQAEQFGALSPAQQDAFLQLPKDQRAAFLANPPTIAPPGSSTPDVSGFVGGQPGTGGSGAPSAQTQPAAPAKPAGGGYGMGGDERELRAANKQAMAAQGQLADAIQTSATQKAAQAASDAQAMQLAQADQREKQAKLEADVGQRMQAMQQAYDDASKNGGTVDAGRWWNSRTTGQKVLAGVSAFLSGLGGGPDYVQQAIQQDIEIQKDTLDRQDKAKARRIEGARTLYGLAMERLGDSRSAFLAASAQAKELAAKKAEELDALATGQQAKANSQVLQSQLRQSAAKDIADLHQRQSDLGIKRMQAESEVELRKAEAMKDLMGKGMNPQASAKIAQVDSAITALDGLAADWKKTGSLSALTGKLGSTAAGRYNDKLKSVVDEVSIPLRGGKVMRETDRPTYTEMFPQTTDGMARGLAKIKDLRARLLRERQNAALGAAGPSGPAGLRYNDEEGDE